MSSKLAVLDGAGPAAFTPDDLALIRATVARDATDAEFKLLLVMARELGLNPLLKEIWCIKRRKEDPALIMTSRDGYMKVARRDPAFEGLSSCAVRKGDDFRFDAATGGVHHSFGAERGPIIGAWAGAYARGRRPCVVFADFSEYGAGGSPVWRQYPSAMICKVAESMALKRQFGIDGVVTREEMDASGDYAPPQVEVIPPQRHAPNPITVQAETAPVAPATPSKPSTNAIKRMFALSKEAQVGETHMKRILRAVCGVTSSKDLTAAQVAILSGYLAGLAGKEPRDMDLEEQIEAKLAELDAQEMAEAAEAVVQ